MQTFNKQQFLDTLKHFSGSETFYKNPLFKNFVFTEGVQYVAQETQSYWLIDFIFSHQNLDLFKSNIFQVWTIHTANNTGKILVSDGNNKPLDIFELKFTDFPLEKITLWFVEQTLLLPSEY